MHRDLNFLGGGTWYERRKSSGKAVTLAITLAGI